jgi:leader peptidase (prepilin peptidase)/N-methyltransferase
VALAAAAVAGAVIGASRARRAQRTVVSLGGPRRPWAVVGAAAGAALAVACLHRFGWSWEFVAYAVLMAAAIEQTIVDASTKLLVRGTTNVAGGLGLVLLTVAALVRGEPGRIGTMLSCALLVGASLGLVAVAARGGLGAGDVRLGAVLAMYTGWLGWSEAATAVATGIAAAGAVALLLIAVGRATLRTRIALGPFLLVAAVVTVLASPVR